jgi:hypothetical protein
MATHAQWVVGIASVVFDVDVGQKVNNLVPEDALSAEEQKAVAFHAFPVGGKSASPMGLPGPRWQRSDTLQGQLPLQK